MTDQRAIASIETELARDNARLLEINKLETQMLSKMSHRGFRAAVQGVRFRAEKEMLADRIFRNKCLLVTAKH